MNKNYRTQLMTVLIIFAFTLASTIAFIDYFQFKNKITKMNDIIIDQAIDVVTSSLQLIDESIHMHGDKTDEAMEETLYYLQSYYEDNRDIATWDLDEMFQSFGYDIYIINEDYEIIHSNVTDDIGINFNTCCASLKSILDERRQSKQPFIDGIEISQKNQHLIKFGYITTKDKQYIIEIGLNIEDTSLSSIYNYVNLTNKIVDDLDIIDNIHILNMGGYSYNANGKQIDGDRLATFRKSRDSETSQELVRMSEDGVTVHYRYVPITLPYEQGTTKLKIVEVSYNESGIREWLSSYTKRFFIQLILILAITVLLANVISKRFAKMSYLAYHDGLTGLQNRSAFEEQLQQIVREGQSNLTLCFIDLDRFKLVNDHLGHQKGDELLQSIGNKMKEFVSDDGVYRLGGDEFIILFNEQTKESVLQQVKQVLKGIERDVLTKDQYLPFKLSASAGVVFMTEEDTIQSIKDKADIALQHAKLKGKNQYQIYKEE